MFAHFKLVKMIRIFKNSHTYTIDPAEMVGIYFWWNSVNCSEIIYSIMWQMAGKYSSIMDFCHANSNEYEFRASKMCWNLNRCANIWFASTAKSLQFQRIRSIEIESNVSNSICKPIECFSNVPFSNNASKLCEAVGGFEWWFWMTNSNDVHDLSMQCNAVRSDAFASTAVSIRHILSVPEQRFS